MAGIKGKSGIYKRTKKHKMITSISTKKAMQKPNVKKKMKGRKLSKEHKRKLSEAHKGKKHTKKAKQKMSLSWKGRIRPKFSKKWRDNMSKARTGKKLSKEIKLKIGKGNKGKQVSKVTREKMSKVHKLRVEKGLNNFWKGGISFEPYSKDWTLSLKRSIRERDGYICRVCGKKQKNKLFDVHHIDYNKKNCNPDNLITLCHSCHSKTNTNRDYWIKFLELLKIIK